MTTKLILSLGKAPCRLPACRFNEIVTLVPLATYKLRPSRVEGGGEKAAAVLKEAPTRLCLRTSEEECHHCEEDTISNLYDDQ